MQMQVIWPLESMKLEVDTRPDLQRQPQTVVPCLASFLSAGR